MEESQIAASKPKKRWGATLVKFVIWCIPMAISIMVWAQYQQMVSAFDNYEQLNNSDQKKFIEQVSEIKEKVIVLERGFSTAHETLNTLQAQVAKSQEADKKRRIVLVDVKNLIQLAQWQFSITHQIIPTQNLLKAAVERISSLEDPKLSSLQLQLAQALVQVNVLAKLDRIELSLQLRTLARQITQLSRMPSTKKAEPVSASNLSWQQQLQQTWEGLQKIMIIRKHDQPVQPLLTEQEKTLFDLNIQLLAEEANWGVWQSDNALYRDSLEKIKNWVTTYYGSDASVIKQIEKLQGVNVTSQSLNFDAMLNQVQQLLNV
ncbi:MAG: uroporphyrinogen-III C-methyltransferase [Proteobacteria bacterium]|nr:uroporphyrinogen-III C-methyltransferase [Pseudomonadota bacterium]